MTGAPDFRFKGLSDPVGIVSKQRLRLLTQSKPYLDTIYVT